MYINWKH